MTIRLLLADDQAMVRSALAALLDLEDDFEVVAEVARGDEVVPAALEHHPDVALLDIEMPGLDGLAAAAALDPRGARLPGADPHHLRPARATCAGPWRRARSASSSRTRPPSSWPTPSGGWPPASGWSTPRWRPPPWRAAPRRSPAASATSWWRRATARPWPRSPAALVLSEGTVRNYLSSAIAKTGARNRVEAGRVADERGWL